MKFNKATLVNFDLTPEEQEFFIKELEKISGHPILEEADTKNAAKSVNENKAATTPKNNDTQKENTKVKQIKSKVKPAEKKPAEKKPAEKKVTEKPDENKI